MQPGTYWPPGLPYPGGASVPPHIQGQLNLPDAQRSALAAPQAPPVAPAPSFAQPGLSEMFSSQAYQDAMRPAEFIGRKAPQKPQGEPQSTYVGLQHSTPSSPSKDVPGSGVVGFVNGGALPVFRQGFAGSQDEQGPVPQHAMSGKRVGVEEGSFAHSIAGSPMEQFLKLFGYGGGY